MERNLEQGRRLAKAGPDSGYTPCMLLSPLPLALVYRGPCHQHQQQAMTQLKSGSMTVGIRFLCSIHISAATSLEAIAYILRCT